MIRNKLVRDICGCIEFLDTTEGDSIPCISIEQLSGVLWANLIITESEMKQMNRVANGSFN